MVSDPTADISIRPLPWLSSFSLGDAKLDQEHRALIDSANELCTLAQLVPDPARVREAAAALLKAADDHARSEEALFPTLGYRARIAHGREHLHIHRSLHALLIECAPLDLKVACATARLLLVEHILRHDLGVKTWIDDAAGQ